jgi:squalene-hopene/tetraprenyl-beta-curcumene cyclase
MDFLDELQESIIVVENHIWSNYQPEGRIHGVCASRAIETALTVQLLKGMEDCDDLSEKLIAFCVTYLNEISEQDSTENEVYKGISKLFVSAVVSERAGVDPVNDFEQILGRFNHPSKERKHVLYSVLLAEVGLLSFEEIKLSQHCFDSPNNQSWTSLVMIAAKVIYGLNTKAFTVSDEDLNLLVDGQSEDGSWDCHIFAGLIILIALKKTGQFSSAIEKGLTFVKAQIRPDGGVPFIPDVDCWITALSGIVFSRRNQPKHSDAMADYIRKIQLEDGGWGFRKGLSASDTDDTSLCVLFLQLSAAEKSQQALSKGLKVLLDSQNTDGGFTTYVRGAPSEVEVTAHVIMSLSAEQRKHDSIIESACKWLATAQGADGSFRSEWVDTNLYSVSQVLFAINTLSNRNSLINEMAARGGQFLLKQQNIDGGWGNFHGAQSTALSTSYALIGLLSFDRIPAAEAVARGMRFLLTQQSENVVFRSAPDALGPRPLVYDIKLFAAIYGLWALYELEAKWDQLPKIK